MLIGCPFLVAHGGGSRAKRRSGLSLVTEELTLRHFIGGQWSGPLGEESVDIINPATEEVIARVPRATPREAERAILAARRAFDDGPWPRLPLNERARILRGLADALARNRDRLI